MQKFKAYSAALIAVTLFSSVEVATKLLGSVAYPFELVFLRFFVTGLILLLIALPDFRRQTLIKLGWKDFKILLLNASIGIAFSISLFHWGIIRFEKAASAAVVFCINPLFVVILARFINDEKITIRKIFAVILGMAGITFFALESGTFSNQSLTALVIMTLSALSFAISACICRKYVGYYGAVFFMGASSLLGSIIILPFAIFSVVISKPYELIELWKTLVYIIFLGTAVPYVCYYYAFKHASAFSVSMINCMKPVMASVLAAIVLHEKINNFMVIGIILVMVALIVNLLPIFNYERANVLEKMGQ